MAPSQTYPDTREGVTQLLKEMADPDVLERANELEDAGTHGWIPDPDVRNVWGFVQRSNPRRALIVAYLADGDFETSDELWD